MGGERNALLFAVAVVAPFERALITILTLLCLPPDQRAFTCREINLLCFECLVFIPKVKNMTKRAGANSISQTG